MHTSIAAGLGAIAAAAWFLYVRSLPVRVALGATHRDASTLAIGVGVFLLVQLVAAPRRLVRRPLPAARARKL